MSNETTHSDGYLDGQLLIAMPGMQDPRFIRTVIYLCAHSNEGAMGLVINRLVGSLTFESLAEQLDIETGLDCASNFPAIHFGGPVETGRGFILHSPEFTSEDTVAVDDNVSLTATVEILEKIAVGQGPDQRLLALGYAGWGPGQLDAEIQENAWLHVDADADLLFDDGLDDKWDRALAKIGIDAASLLSVDAGRA